MTNNPLEVAFVGKAPGTYLMLLGGGYYGQRLNKIYRGSTDLFRTTLFSNIVSSLRRERDRARDPSHPQAYDQTVRPRETRRRTLWRFRDPCRLYIAHDGGKGMVRRHGRRGSLSRDCCMIYLFIFICCAFCRLGNTVY